MGTAKAISFGLFPHTCGRRDPPDRLHIIARSPTRVRHRYDRRSCTGLVFPDSPSDYSPASLTFGGLAHLRPWSAIRTSSLSIDRNKRLPSLTVQVDRPLIWWRASFRELSTVLSDPDKDDGSPRWSTYAQDWKAIGTTVCSIADAIATGSYTIDPDFPFRGNVTVQAPPLEPLETKIVKSWFSYGEAPSHDPWSDRLYDGRHRLWHTFKAFQPQMRWFRRSQGVRLPFRSHSLFYSDPANLRELGQGWEKGFQKDLSSLESVRWFTTNDPLNARYKTSLVTAAAGRSPFPAG